MQVMACIEGAVVIHKTHGHPKEKVAPEPARPIVSSAGTAWAARLTVSTFNPGRCYRQGTGGHRLADRGRRIEMWRWG